MRESLEEAAEAGREEGLAASEIRTRVGEIGDATLECVDTDDPGYREEAEESQTGFEEARARYGEPVGKDGGRGSEIDACYREYAPLSETMMDENDEKEAAQTQVSEGYAGSRASSRRFRRTLHRQETNGSGKGEEAASMSAAAADFEESLTSYIQESPIRSFWLPPPAALAT